MRKRSMMTAMAATLAVFAGGLFLMAQSPRTPAAQLKAAENKEQVEGDLKGAIELYKKLAQSSDNPVAARALVRLGASYEKQGNAEARKTYEQVLNRFGDQKDAVEQAKARLAALGGAGMAPGITSRLVWTLPEDGDINGTVSRDGRYLPYIDWKKFGDLYVHDLVTGADRQLTNTGTDGKPGENVVDEFAEEYAFSPDDSQLAYSWYRDDRKRYEIRVVDLRSAGVPQFRTIFDNPDVDWIEPRDWSPDGKWLAVAIGRKDKTCQIGLVSVQDGSLRVLRTVSWPASDNVFFSPDGQYVGYDAPEPELPRMHDVFVMSIDGSREIPVAPHRGQDDMAGWSPDGKEILFASDRSGALSLWGIRFAAGSTQGVPEFKGELGQQWTMSMGVTQSGVLFSSLFDRGDGGSSIKIASFDPAAGIVTSPAAEAGQGYPESDLGPFLWSPDGKYFAYTVQRGGGRTALTSLAIRSEETGAIRELRPKLNNWVFTEWAPDSKSFLVQGRDLKGQQGYFEMDAQTGQISAILLQMLDDRPLGAATWTADGRGIYYRRALAGNKEFALIQRDLSSGVEKEILRTPGNSPVIVSPDGHYLVIANVDPATNSRVALLIPAAGGESRVLMSVPSGTAPENLRNYQKGVTIVGFKWAPDSRSLLLRKHFTEGPQSDEVWRVPLDGSAPVKTGLQLERSSAFSMSPDWRKIAYTVVSDPRPPKMEVWVLENFLPRAAAIANK